MEPTPRTERPKIAYVSTRALDEKTMAGRLHVARSIVTALEGWSDLDIHLLPCLLTEPTAGRALEATLAAAGSLFSGPLLPLQCALFAGSSDIERLIERLPADVSAVYLDGVRSYAMLAALRRRRPELRIVADLDDLMSRRMDLLMAAGESLSPGYLAKRLPPLLRGLVTAKALGRMIVRYERSTLRRIERRICDLADAVVLVSAEDARALAASTPGRNAQIVAIPPPSPPPSDGHPFVEPGRFVFVGSDALTQNRMTIDYLVGLWRRHAIATPLVLYGHHARALDLPPGVQAAGYAEQIADIYDGRSVLLTPSKIGGGIKTKVLEAFAYGAPVIGNSLTFEALPIGNYPLLVEDEAELAALLLDPMGRRALFEEAVAHGLNYIAQNHGADAFASRWRNLLEPGPGRARRAQAQRRPIRAVAAFSRTPDAAPPDPAPL